MNPAKILTISIILIGCSAFGQQYVDYNINFKSSKETDCSADVLIKFADSKNLPSEKFLKQELDSITKNVLKNYSSSDIYYFQKFKIDSILTKSISSKLKKANYQVEEAFIRNVDIAEETKNLVDYLLKLEQDYLEVELKIFDREQKIKELLKSNKELNQEEIKRLREELFVLENSKYIRDIYYKNLKIISFKKN